MCQKCSCSVPEINGSLLVPGQLISHPELASPSTVTSLAQCHDLRSQGGSKVIKAKSRSIYSVLNREHQIKINLDLDKEGLYFKKTVSKGEENQCTRQTAVTLSSISISKVRQRGLIF